MCPTLELPSHCTALPGFHQLPANLSTVTVTTRYVEKRVPWVCSDSHLESRLVPSQCLHIPFLPGHKNRGTGWLSLHGHLCLPANVVAWALWAVAYRQDQALLCFMDQQLRAWEGNTGLASSRTFQEETALSVCRYSFKFQTLVLRHTSAVCICTVIDENRNGFPLYLYY